MNPNRVQPMTNHKKNHSPDTPTGSDESSLKNPYLLLRKNKNTPEERIDLSDRINTSLYERLTDKLLEDLYPKHCKDCQIPVRTILRTRRSVLRCHLCNQQISRFKNTPLESLKIPHWMFGYILHESYQQYPKVITSKEIQKRLGIAYNIALLLKRRIQLFSQDMMPKIKNHITSHLGKPPEIQLPQMNRENPKESILPQSSTPIVNADTIVLFSASQRANKGRKRHRHGGQTASIYLSDALGGKQIGSLVHTIAIKGGGVLFQYIQDQTTQSLGSQIAEVIPKHSYIFTDEGYPFLQGIYKNHRMVNHSIKSRDKRYRFSGNRWCQNGVHNQVAEGFNNRLKTAFRSYGYFKPENAGMYLSEFSLMANIRHYGLDAILVAGSEGRTTGSGVVGLVSRGCLAGHLIDEFA